MKANGLPMRITYSQMQALVPLSPVGHGRVGRERGQSSQNRAQTAPANAFAWTQVAGRARA